ncbi:Fe-S cluster assembly protein HesB [Catenulispora sp. NF23]|uniref:HhH-GPD-type base excision DNA repair protein n=1 Tax=Catenulispora pinistramenti TaxID=2705254 RepID=UPI001BA9EC58|nr:HhH-GPD-type base excision DNA repair protein [Catenulispora pinistramenti]MBS2539815.1 Fe-S cluster assembly protein HesB [Catenulispora pinistramenti]
MVTLHLAQDPAADAFLEKDSLGVLTGLLLDQQIPMEKAFAGPYVLATRLGVKKLDAGQIADYDPEKFVALFSEVPAIHRFPKSMAERTQKLARAVVEEYDGDASAVWTEAKDGADLLKRVSALPGYGKQKAQILVALLGKQLGVTPAGWREAAGDYGTKGSTRSVADVTDAASLVKVRAFKKEMKAAAKAKEG